MISILPTELPGVQVLRGRLYADDRGYFTERYRKSELAAVGINDEFVQDNLSKSSKFTLRGLHYQEPNAQGKLLFVVSGRIFDVVVDIRVGSPTFKKWISVELTEVPGDMLWVPPGFAHGFMALEDDTHVIYKVTDYWAPECEHTIHWNDPELAIDWPAAPPILNDKDSTAPNLRDVSMLPEFTAS